MLSKEFLYTSLHFTSFAHLSVHLYGIKPKGFLVYHSIPELIVL